MSEIDARKQLRARSASVSIEALLVAGLISVGLLERVTWIFLRPTPGGSGEAFNVARAIAEGRGFADAYHVGQGSTAHLLPISPGIAGLVYRTFGVNAPAAEFILSTWALLLTFSTYVLLYRTFGRLGVPVWARIGSLAFLCIAPTYIGQEAADFRVWEGGLASFLAALFLDRLTAAAQARNRHRPQIALAVIAAVLFFVSPPMGLGAILCAGVFALTRLSLQQTLVSAAVGIVVLACLLLPWTLRNQAALGEPVFLRSNAGLELAIANHARAATDDNPGEVFRERLSQIHPAHGAAVRKLQQMGGEIAYSRRLGAEAAAWMRANKSDAARLTLRHIRQMIAPEPWMFRTFGTGRAAGLRAALASTAGIAGLLGFLLVWLRHRGEWIYPLIMVSVPVLAIAVFQPVPRYTYLVYPLLGFGAGALASHLGMSWRSGP